jgi:hypothetical protein
MVQVQVTLVASPRNHLNLLNGRVALIERPVFLSGKAEDFLQDRRRGRFPACPAGSASVLATCLR